MRNMKISAKLILIFLTIGITGSSILGFVAFRQSKKALMEKTFEQLVAIREIKKNQIEGYFRETIGDMRVYSNNTAVQMATERYIDAFQKKGLNSDLYRKWEELHGQRLQQFANELGYDDILIISANGDIVFSVKKQADLGQNVVTGPLSKTGVGKAFRDCRNEVCVVDYEFYEISGKPEAFVAGPIIDLNKQFIGLLVFAISSDEIGNIMHERSGMGKTGETYLVGSDKLMRSDSYLDPDTRSVKASFLGNIAENGVDTKASNDALAGKTGVGIIKDYRNVNVLSAYSPVFAGKNQWAFLAEIDEAEVLLPVRRLAVEILLVTLAIVISISLLGIFFARSISRPLVEGVEFAKKMSIGDLSASIQVRSNDEIGILAGALNDMGQKIREIVSSILTGANGIVAASQQITSASSQLSQSSSEQAASTEEASSSMEEMVSNIEQNTDNAQQTEKISQKAAKAISTGYRSVEDTVRAMKTITERISVIGEIAEKTDLLAINAAIEAARAGEHGKGFAVVAAEVRKLAERSQTAAREINEVSASSVRIADEAGKLLESIVPEVEKTASLVQEIAAASIEQNSGATQINNTIQQLTMITQQNAASSEELASSAEELNSQAENMKELASFFKIDGREKNQKNTANAKHNPGLKQFRTEKNETVAPDHKKDVQLKPDHSDLEFEKY
jgi:methyl-accepting chemotaxis protein